MVLQIRRLGSAPEWSESLGLPSSDPEARKARARKARVRLAGEAKAVEERVVSTQASNHRDAYLLERSERAWCMPLCFAIRNPRAPALPGEVTKYGM